MLAANVQTLREGRQKRSIAVHEDAVAVAVHLKAIIPPEKGEISVAEVVLTCPWEAQSMTIADLLMSQRRWGVTRCRKLLQYVPMSETKEVGSMTTRQRHALAELLEASASERHELARQPRATLSLA